MTGDEGTHGAGFAGFDPGFNAGAINQSGGSVKGVGAAIGGVEPGVQNLSGASAAQAIAREPGDAVGAASESGLTGSPTILPIPGNGSIVVIYPPCCGRGGANTDAGQSESGGIFGTSPFGTGFVPAAPPPPPPPVASSSSSGGNIIGDVLTGVANFLGI